MLSEESAVEIKVLARQGKGIREIARETGCSRNTVRRYVREAAPSRYKLRAPRQTKLAPYQNYVRERVKHAKPDWIPATVLLVEIRERGYDGGISQLKTFMATLKPKAVLEPIVRFETEPGQQMQVDFVIFRRGPTALSALVATLGYSRMSFVRFGDDERFETVKAGLLAAFDYFGGVPCEILFDNMKTVVQDRDAYGPGKHRYHPGLLDLAKTHGFKPRLCRPYRAQTKGKVERFNRYLRHSFFVPLAAELAAVGLLVDVPLANARVLRWLREVANVRLHGTLQAKPLDRLALEQAHLLPFESDPGCLPIAQGPMPTPVESLQHPLAVYAALMPEVI
jgi:transposase